MISTDAHAQEPDTLWLELPARFRERLPRMRFRDLPHGAADPALRLVDQDACGVEAEVLFPSKAMALFGMDDVETQVAAFRLYNDWMADYCRTAPRRFHGVLCLSVYDIDGAIAEMRRGHDMGLKGALLWQSPDPRLPFTSPHYEKLWAAAAEAGQPIVCHILTGHSGTTDSTSAQGADRIRNAVNRTQNDTMTTLFDFIFSGAFDRHPRMRLLLAESGIGWLPFVLQQWDYYYDRIRRNDDVTIRRKPSEIFEEHVFGTFLEDHVGARAFSWWGVRNCMWSTDYPDFKTTSHHSSENEANRLAGLDEPTRRRLTRENAIEFFNLDR